MEKQPQTRKRSQKLQEKMFIAIFTVLIAAGAFIKIPIPVVPFTLQVLFVLLAGVLLGSRQGAESCLVYLLLGLAGVPVFAEGGGIWYVLKPSFGYLIGFPVGAFFAGKIREGHRGTEKKWFLPAMLAGLVIIYIFGTVYCFLICGYVLDIPMAAGTLLVTCVLMTIPGDLCLCIVGAFLARRLLPVRKAML